MQTVKSYHLNRLKRELATHSRHNPLYSLRAFARDLGVTPSWLSEFFNRKRGMSVELAQKIAKNLGLNSAELQSFILSAQASHARSPGIRARAHAEFRAQNQDIARAKDFIREVQRGFAEKFYDPHAKKDSVYQLSIQLFRLDHNQGEKS